MAHSSGGEATPALHQGERCGAVPPALHHILCRRWAQGRGGGVVVVVWQLLSSSRGIAHLSSAQQTAVLILSTCPCAAALLLAAGAARIPETAKSPRRAVPDSPERNVPTPNRHCGFSQRHMNPAWLPAARKCERCPPPTWPGSGGCRQAGRELPGWHSSALPVALLLPARGISG